MGGEISDIQAFKLHQLVAQGLSLEEAVQEEGLAAWNLDVLRARVEEMGRPTIPIEALAQLWKNLESSFGLDDPYILEVELSTIVTVGMPGDPLWVFIVGPPSGLKSETLRWTRGAETVYTTSSLTPHALITGLKGGHDLIPLLDGKTLVIKDFSPILEMRRESRDAIFSQLRDAFDGYIEQDFATVGHKDFDSHFHILAGVTSAIEKYYAVQSWLGQRFLKARITEAVDGFRKALEGAGNEKEIRKGFKRLVREVLEVDLESWSDVDSTLVSELRPTVDLVGKARTHVPRDWNSNISALPEPELPPRLTKQLKKICIGRAMVYRRESVNEDDVAFARRLALDTIPSLRRRAMEAFLDGPYPIGEFRHALGLPERTTYRLVEDLEILDLIEGTRTSGATVYELGDEYSDTIRANFSGKGSSAGNVRGYGVDPRTFRRLPPEDIRAGRCRKCRFLKDLVVEEPNSERLCEGCYRILTGGG